MSFHGSYFRIIHSAVTSFSEYFLTQVELLLITMMNTNIWLLIIFIIVFIQQ